MAGNTTEPGRSVASRCLSVLDAFAPEDGRLSLAVLADRTQLPKPTVHRYVRELVRGGALVDCGGGRYQVSTRLFELGAAAARSRGMRWVAQPVMEDLHRATGHNVHLGVWHRDRVIVVARIAGSRSIATPARSGERLPAHATSLGKVLLAHADEQVRAAVLAGPLERYTPHTITVASRLLRQLERVQELGIATAREERSTGTASVAVPVHGAEGEVVAGLSVVVPTEGGDIEQFAPALRVAARTIGRRWIKVQHH